jgi:hypothetical protein
MSPDPLRQLPAYKANFGKNNGLSGDLCDKAWVCAIIFINHSIYARYTSL